MQILVILFTVTLAEDHSKLETVRKAEREESLQQTERQWRPEQEPKQCERSELDTFKADYNYL